MNPFAARNLSPRPRPLEIWTRAFAEAMEDLGPEALGVDLAGVTSYRPEPAPGSVGLLVPLNGEAELLQFGLFAAPGALRLLAAAELGRSDGGSPTEIETVGGVTDLIEMLVGAVEARLMSRENSSRGVPVFLHSDGLLVGPTDERAGLQMQVGPVEVTLLVVRRLI